MSGYDEQTGSVECPRCGYDQRGIVATWKNSCPLEGVCSECGLQYRWVEILVPEKFEPLWCVEFVPSAGQIPAATLKTWARSFWPWVFWSRLRMTMPIRWGRLAIYLLLLLILLILLNVPAYVTIQTSAAIQVRTGVAQSIQAHRASLQRQVPLTKQRLVLIDAELERLLEIPIAERGSTPIEMDKRAVPRSIDTVKEAEAFLKQRSKVLTAWVKDREQFLQTNPSVGLSYTGAVMEALFRPLSPNSQGTITTGDGTSPYVAPRLLHAELDRLRLASFPGSDLSSHVTRGLLFLEFGLGILLFLPLSFILLPISRRRAKVRCGHICRVVAYGLFIPLTLIPAAGLCVAIGFAAPSRMESMLLLGEVLIALPMVIATIIWWAVAIKCYLRMDHPLAVTLAVSATAFFASCALIFVLHPRFIILPLSRLLFPI